MNLLKATEASLENAVAVLRAGGVVALPTETVYGLAALWRLPDAREKIYLLKHRPENKQLQMLADSIPSAIAAGLLPDPRLDAIAQRFWPGPLTVVAHAANGATIGLRIPAHPFVLRLLQHLGEPLACTSANLSGEAPGLDAQSAIAHLDGAPDLVLDGGPVPPGGGQPSTVASLLGERVTILREGPVTLAELEDAVISGQGRRS